MDNLPNDPPNQNNNSNNSTPPPFGSNFNPHTNPVDPNNPYPPPAGPVPDGTGAGGPPPVDPVQSWIAKHQQRDSHGRFIPEQPNQTPSNPPPSTSPSLSQKLKSIFIWISKIKWKKMTLYIMGASTFIYLVINNPAF